MGIDLSIITGEEYIKRIDNLKNEVWIEGEQVKGKISEHPAFQGILKSKAALYDLQHDPTSGAILTRTSVENNEQFNFAFEQPTTKEDLKKRRVATQLWAKNSAGTIGRSPDYVNTVIMTLGTSYPFFKGRYADNIQNILSNALKNDLSFTHTFVNPQVNRSPHHNEFTSVNNKDTKDKIIGAKGISPPRK